MLLSPQRHEFSVRVEAWVFIDISPVPLEQCLACVFVEYMEGWKGEGRSSFCKLMILPRGYITIGEGEENAWRPFHTLTENSVMCPHQP